MLSLCLVISLESLKLSQEKDVSPSFLPVNFCACHKGLAGISACNWLNVEEVYSFNMLIANVS